MAQASTPERPPAYRLSAVLSGHTNDVRCVIAESSRTPTKLPRLASASRDGTVRLWSTETEKSPAAPEWRESFRWCEEDRAYENCVAFVPADNKSGRNGYLATGGADSLVQLYPLDPPQNEPAFRLSGHAHNVCALDVSADGCRIVSASWDMTARVWEWSGPEEGYACEKVLVDHEAAVWDVLFLRKEPDLLLTASADTRVRLFDLATAEVRYTFKGHTGPVRALAKLLPEDLDCALFATASNDGTILIWNYQSGDSITTLGSHDSFIYSLASLPATGGGGLASAGEDGIVKIWNEDDGELDQEILVPALSVWSVTALPNGDLACACSDNLVWIFTRDATRCADATTTSKYESELEQRRRPKAPPSAPTISDESALKDEGNDDQVKLVRKGSRVFAYQWHDNGWQEMGERIDRPEADRDEAASQKPQPPRMEHDGQDYDFVFSIDVADNAPPLPLPYNRDSDAQTVAAAFIRAHSLPETYIERIVDFIAAHA